MTKTPTLEDQPGMFATLLAQNHIPFGYRIGYVSNVFSGPVYKTIERDFGIRRPMFATLFSLAHLKQVTASDVCAVSGISKNTISRAVNEMLSKGYIQRSVDAQDNRRSNLALTVKGRALYEKLLPLFQHRQGAMVQVLSKAERIELERLLTKLILRADGYNEVY